MKTTIQVPVRGLVHPRDRKKRTFSGAYRHRIDRVLISSTWIRRRVRELARQLVGDLRLRRSSELELVVVLKGGAVFANALAREICRLGGPPVIFNYITASSYGSRTVSSGTVRIAGQIPFVRNKDILIVEDIADTGLTLARLKEYLLTERRAASVRICALLDKPSRRKRALKNRLALDYVGFRIPDIFVAGYGSDCAEHLRELPFIVAVKRRGVK